MSIREDVSKMKLVSPYVAALSVSKRNEALKKVAEAIEIKKDEIFAENEKDLEEIDQTVRSALHFITANHVDRILEVAFQRRLKPRRIQKNEHSSERGNELRQ